METKLCGFSGLNVLISNNQASKLLVNQIHTYSNVITLIIYTFIHSFIPSIIYIYIYNIIIKYYRNYPTPRKPGVCINLIFFLASRIECSIV